MKNVKILSVITLFSALLISCNDFLDKVQDNRAELSTDDKIAQILVTAYPLNSYAYMCEMSSDNTDDNARMTSSGLFQQEVFNWEDPSEYVNDGPRRMWGNTYKAIASANQAISAIKKQGFPARLNSHYGEALICRAYGHFLLSYMFCKPYSSTAATDLGLPYMESPETEVFVGYKRGTLEDLYSKINADIEKGLKLIDDRRYSVPKYHFNKKAAYAFAARFNLFYRKYNKVAEYADVVLGGDPSLVLRNWSEWSRLPIDREVMGDTYVAVSDKANLLMYTVYSNWARTHAPVSGFAHNGSRYTHNKYIADTETVASPGPWGATVGGVIPYNLSYWYTDASAKVCVRKINEYFELTETSSTGNSSGFVWNITTMFTTDQTLLERAEAYALAGNLDASMNDLRIFMQRFLRVSAPDLQTIVDYYDALPYYEYNAPTPKKKFNTDMPIEAGNQENLLHCILHLKRILTLHEGMRWSDINRYGIEIYRRVVTAEGTITSTDKLIVNDPRRVFQIPTEVIQAGLEKNPR